MRTACEVKTLKKLISHYFSHYKLQLFTEFKRFSADLQSSTSYNTE